MRDQSTTRLGRLAATGAVLLALAAGVLYCAAPALAAEGQGCPNEQLRKESDINPNTQLPYSTELPDCRAYELVSPSYTEGQAVGTSVANETHAILDSIIGSFAGSSGDEKNVYEATRTSRGWVTEALDPPDGQFPGQYNDDVAANLDATLWQLRTSSQSVHAGSYYLREPQSPAGVCPAGASIVASACFVEVGPLVQPALTEGQPPEPANDGVNYNNLFASMALYMGASSDLSHVFFSLSTAAAEDYLWPGDKTTKNNSLYEYVGTGEQEPRLVGVSNPGYKQGSEAPEAPLLISSCGTELGSSLAGTDKYNAISSNGETVFFTPEAEVSGKCTGPKVNELYAQVDEAENVDVSEPPLSVPGRACTSTCEADEAVEADRKGGAFQGASENGEKVFFLTEQPLLNGDEDTKQDLYEEKIKDGQVEKLIQVSHDPVANQAAEVQGVARVAENGERVYFLAKGQLASNENANKETATAGADNLYVYEPPGQTTFIARLSPSDSADWNATDSRPVAATPNGEFLVFDSVADLTSDDTSKSVTQVFEYDAHTGELVRVSSGQRGDYECTATGHVEEGYNCDGNTETNAAEIEQLSLFTSADRAGSADLQSRVVSEDGAYVFFQSADGLTPYATAGETDAYEYHWTPGAPIAEGRVQLLANGREVSTGGEKVEAKITAATASGENVFMTIPTQLVGQQTDTQIGLYDARIGGGFPAPAPAPAACSSGEVWSCQGSAATPPSAPAPGSTGAPSVGDLTPGPVVSPPPTKTKPKAKPLTRAQKLTKALKLCEKDKSKKKRASCERAARRKYGPVKPKSHHAAGSR